MTAEADQFFLAQQAELGKEAILRYEMDPSAYFNIMFQKAKADANKRVDGRMKNPIASLDLHKLDEYMQRYNMHHGSEELTLRKVMSRCIKDDAELESILSIMNHLKRNKIHVASVRLGHMFVDSNTVEEAAVKLGIPAETTGVLNNDNVDIFVRFTGIFAREHPDQLPVIVEQLTKRFGDRQAALLVHKMKWYWKGSYDNLRAELYQHWVEKGTTPDMLHDKITEARKERAGRRARHGGKGFKEVETVWENALLDDYRPYYESHQFRKRKRASDTSVGTS